MGLDSLSNNIVQKAIASMAACQTSRRSAASIYNFYGKKPDVVLIIDEIAEAINEQVIQILNKGRGAGSRRSLRSRRAPTLKRNLETQRKCCRFWVI